MTKENRDKRRAARHAKHTGRGTNRHKSVWLYVLILVAAAAAAGVALGS